MAGTYTLTVTNTTSGCQNSAATVVVVNALPVATAANNGPVCVGNPIVLAGGPSGMTTYHWTGPNGYSNNTQNPVVSSSATTAMAGVYTLTVTNSNGCLSTATTTVVVNAVPVATATNNGPVCAGRPLILTGGPAGMLSYSWTGPNGFVSNLQSPTVSATATVAMAGVYTLVVTNGTSCTSTITTTAVVNPAPVATASNLGPVCVGSALNLTGGPSGMTTYSWTGPNSFTSTQMSPQVSASATLVMGGLYTLTVTSANGCQDTATTRTYVYAVPVSNAGTGGTECDLNFVLNAVPSVGTGLWTMVTGTGTASFAPNANTANATVTVTAYGTYTFRWTETNGPCTSSSVITVNFYQQPVANAGTGGNECDLNFVFSAVPSAGTGTWTMASGTGTATFSNANSPTSTVTVTTYGTKVFTWTEVNGTCTNSANVTVNFYQQPVADAGTGGNNCGNSFNLKAVPSVGTGTWTRISGPGNATFSPNANTATAKVTITAYGVYVFRWTELNGTCSSFENVSVTFIQDVSADAGNGGDECDLNFRLNAVAATGGIWSLNSGPSGGTATFSPNASTANATVTVSRFGSYEFAWTITNSFCTSSDIINVNFHDLPSLDAGNDLSVCKGSGIQLSASGTGTFSWSPVNLLNNPSIPNPVATPVITTTFTVTLTDAYGCKRSDQVNVEVRNQPVAHAGSDQTLEYLFDTELEAEEPGVNETGEWTLLSGSGHISDINDPATTVTDLKLGENSFIWTVTNGVCPIASDTVYIAVNDLIIPTLITPNNDGKNDLFIIKGIETLGKTSLTIFNRWGARVFENKVYDNKWNGVNDNEDPLPDDTYFFVLKPEKSKAVSGYIVVRR
jgi:gliding motility-associated-like protein